MLKSRDRIRTPIWAFIAVLVCCGLWLTLPNSVRNHIEPVAHATSIYFVTSADDHDDGVCNANDCTLREAINAANALVNSNTSPRNINFSIPGSGVHTINVTSPLPPLILSQISVNGPTLNGMPLIEINGANAGPDVDGLSFASMSGVSLSGFSGVHNLIINRFSGYGINIGTEGNLIDGCFIGANADGTAAAPNGTGGIRFNAELGGIARNVISGNRGDGIDVVFGDSTIQGNLIGTNATGTAAIPNTGDGIKIENNVRPATIGGTATGSGNIISGNGRIGIHILGSSGAVLLQSNFIGTDLKGTVAIPNQVGIAIEGTADFNTISGNVVSGNRSDGIEVNTNRNTFQGNFIGTNLAGTAAVPNGGDGILIKPGSNIFGSASNNAIGGTATGARNIISGNGGAGIDVTAGIGALVLGNFIGTNASGTAKVPNANGVVLNGSANNTIGGTTAAARNIISGNVRTGVQILNAGATDNLVQGNFIGTDVRGTAEIGNRNGVEIQTGAQDNTIGGTTTGARNVISGNGVGVAVNGGSGTSIAGNFIGPDATGTLAMGNSSGVSISGGSATVGGTAAGSGNVIAGNSPEIVGQSTPELFFEEGGAGGVVITGGSGSHVLGNSIGTIAGEFGYQSAGVVINGSANNIIGGTTVAARNIIAGSAFEGVSIGGAGATNNVVQGNLINGNIGDGVAVGASNNIIGGKDAGAGNQISSNGGAGVSIGTGTGNAILGNSIFYNGYSFFSSGGLGIDLSPFGMTPNDNCDGDIGPNNLQNFPVINSAIANSSTTTIQGTLNSTANAQFRIEFFANATCNSSGNGEGQTFLGFTNVTTDASCNASFTFSVPNTAVTGPIITTTATDSNNNTSEFSACATPMGALPTIQFSAASYTVGEGDKHVEIPITRSGDTSVAASVNFATSDLAGTEPCNLTIGVASSRCDYETRLATVSLAPGETSKTISVSIIDDSYLEGPETFNLKLTNPSGAFIGAPSEATVTITDDDLANGPNLIDVPDVFVRAHYLGFLNREPDQSGFDFWTNQIISCGSDQTCIQLKRINVSAAFFLSIEFQQTGYFVERIYKTAYGDANGFSTNGGPHVLAVPNLRFNQFRIDTQRISAGVIVGQSGWETVLEKNKRAFTMDLAPSAAYAYPALTPSAFVDRLFANAGFTPSSADRNAAIAEFGGAKDISDIAARARALRDVADNSTFIQQEFNRAFVLMDYFGYLRRNPNDNPDSDYTGYDFWLTKLNQFNGDFQKSEMVKAFITSAEYRSRFGPP